MKKNLFFAIAIVAMLFTASCRQVCYDNPLDRPGQVVFAGALTETRITNNNQWSGGEAIGVFATTSATLASGNIHSGAVNRQFTNDLTAPAASAVFRAVTGNEIMFPATGTIYFFAYHPFTATLAAGYELPINVAGQTTPQHLVDLDILRATSSGSNASAVVTLPFLRKMSQIEIEVTIGGALTNLDGLTVTIQGLPTQTNLSLANGTLTTPTNVADITTVRAAHAPGATTATVNAIVIPGPNAGATFHFALGTQTWTWTPPAITMNPSNRYIYQIELTDETLSAVQPGATIGEWLPVNQTPGGPVTVHPPASTPTFEVDVVGGALPTFPETGGTEIITLTADAGISWTITDTSNPWLTITPDAGTGDETITIVASANTGAVRTATITIACDDDPTLYIEIDVTQQGPLLFPGSDFNDLSAFTGLRATDPAASFDATGGIDGSGALRFVRDGTGNQVVFTAMIPDGALTGKSYISFFINGTSGNRTIAVTLARDQGTPPITDAGIIVHAFNFNTATTTIGTSTVTGVHNGTSPQYTGTDIGINTANGWTEVRVPLTGHSMTGVNRFQIRAGGADGALHNWAIDNITVQ